MVKLPTEILYTRACWKLIQFIIGQHFCAVKSMDMSTINPNFIKTWEVQLENLMGRTRLLNTQTGSNIAVSN